MAVQRKPKNNTTDINETAAMKFVSGAGEAMPVKGKKVPVALRFDENLLKHIDAMAVRRGMSRNGLISYWCSKGVESE